MNIYEKRTLENRFWRRVEKSDGCWNWTGAKSMDGYGVISKDGRPQWAHRVLWEMHFKTPISPGHVIMHLCNNKSCVNPDHLKEGTYAENNAAAYRDGLMPSKKGILADTHFNASKTHCPRGHEYTEENTFRSVARPNNRICRKCRIINYHKRKSAATK